MTADDFAELTRILGSACLKCGSTQKPTWDHVVPISKGGPHHPTNLQPLCRPCNEGKQARSSSDYRTDAQREAIAAAFRRAESAREAA